MDDWQHYIWCSLYVDKDLIDAYHLCGLCQLMVDTPAENHPAINFLEGLGFANPVHHVYMSLNISHAAASAAGRPPTKPTLTKLVTSSTSEKGKEDTG